MMKPESKRPITIEDLLRLKRAERPPAEFWTEFDRALRAKQLAALVGKRPWWQSMPRLVFGFRRYHLPIGAAAIAAFAFFAFRSSSHSPAIPAGSETTASKVAVASPAQPVKSQREGRVESVAVTTAPAVAPISVSTVADPSAHVAASTALASIPLIGAPQSEPTREELSPSARAIAANLASVRGSDPVLARTLLGSNATVADLQSTSRAAIEPLQQITPPGDRLRSNLRTAMVSMTSFETPTRTGDRAATRLSEDELYDRIHRFGARGNSVSMKF